MSKKERTKLKQQAVPVLDMPTNVTSFEEKKAQREAKPEHSEDMTKLIAAADANSGNAMDKVIITIDEMGRWLLPRFQRPLKENNKVFAFCENLKTNGGEIAGVITLGRVPGDPNLYKVDGQHRCHAAVLSGLLEFIADVRLKLYADFAAMAKDYALLNDSLVRMRKDDILKAMEETEPALQMIRKNCPFVGYDNVRRASTNSPLVSMSALLRCWVGSANETPGAQSVQGVPEGLVDAEVENLCLFLNLCHTAWQNDPEYYRLWGNLNLMMLMWMFRQLVIKQMAGQKRHSHTTMKAQTFRNCLLSVSAASDYGAWLQGRNISERDRSPCYRRLREIFSKRLKEDGLTGGRTPKFPSPAWSKAR